MGNMIKSGEYFTSDDGREEYLFERDFHPGEDLTPWHVTAMGGTPEPEIGGKIPKWFLLQVMERTGFSLGKFEENR